LGSAAVISESCSICSAATGIPEECKAPKMRSRLIGVRPLSSARTDDIVPTNNKALRIADSFAAL
jgi:hypothetical protein